MITGAQSSDLEAPIVVLTGGVGGAKLVRGLQLIMSPARIVAIVNTGDDFRHLGLYVSPDVDTLLYTLSGKANRSQGWGREGESWGFMAALRTLGGPEWFNLGDGDLALHVLRTARLNMGDALSSITEDFARAWGVDTRIFPMTDDAVSTIIETADGDLEFQRYFVEKQCAPSASAIRFEGAATARPAPGILEAIGAAHAVLIAPSNPYLSVDPILAVPAIKTALLATRAPIVAVSPIVAGNAVKGPTAKLMREFGISVTNESIAAHYADLIDGLLVDSGDDAPADGPRIGRTATIMKTDADRARVAQAALDLADLIAAK